MRIILLFILLFFIQLQIVLSQDFKVSMHLKRGNIEKAKEIIDYATDEKEIKKAETWLLKSEVYKAIYESKYKHIKELDSMPLYHSSEAIIKAFKLEKPKSKKDKPSKTMQKILSQMKFASYHLQRSIGLYNFKNNDYKISLLGFEQALVVDSLIGEIDHSDTLYFYTGHAAFYLEDYKRAIKYYDAAAFGGYKDPLLYINRMLAWKQIGNKEKAFKAMHSGMKRYKYKNDQITDTLLNMYFAQNDTSEALVFIDKSLSASKNNHKLYRAKARIYGHMLTFNELGYRDAQRQIEAIEGDRNAKREKKELLDSLQNFIGQAEDKRNSLQFWINSNYKKALNLKQDYYKANLEYGMLYFDIGKKILDKANMIPIKYEAKFRQEQLNAADWFKRAKPYLEQANESEPNQLVLMKNLLLIYKNCKMPEKERLMTDAIYDLEAELKYKRK